MSIPRGIRNNKVNIRCTGDNWRGMAEVQTDRAFVQFKSLEYGWRAAFRLLTKTYFARYHLQTIRAIISRWAPPQDNNDTKAYIANVSRLTGIDPDESLGDPKEQPHRWMLIGVAMATQENGTSSIDWYAMLRGWGMVDG